MQSVLLTAAPRDFVAATGLLTFVASQCPEEPFFLQVLPRYALLPPQLALPGGAVPVLQNHFSYVSSKHHTQIELMVATDRTC